MKATDKALAKLDQAAGERKRTLVPIDELLSEPIVMDWIVRDHIESDTTGCLYGDSGAFKSFIAIDLLCHVATGKDWCGNPVKAGNVIYICGEGKGGIKRRFRAWFERHGEEPRNIYVRTIPAALIDPIATATLLDEIRQIGNVVMVVVDTLAKNFGDGDESGTRDMGMFVTGMDSIRSATNGAFVLCIHHCGLSDKDRPRGGTPLRSGIDFECSVKRDGNDTVLTFKKMKDGEIPPPLAFSAATQSLPGTDNGKGQELNSLVLEPKPIDAANLPAPAPKPLGKLEQATIDALIELYREQGENLKAGGHDPAGARVSVSDWQQATIGTSEHAEARSRARKNLEKRGMVRIDNGFAYLNG